MIRSSSHFLLSEWLKLEKYPISFLKIMIYPLKMSQHLHFTFELLFSHKKDRKSSHEAKIESITSFLEVPSMYDGIDGGGLS